ncbi:MAG: hypothetical protein WEB89_02370, partial [Balneolales bacterium]
RQAQTLAGAVIISMCKSMESTHPFTNLPIYQFITFCRYGRYARAGDVVNLMCLMISLIFFNR